MPEAVKSDLIIHVHGPFEGIATVHVHIPPSGTVAAALERIEMNLSEFAAQLVQVGEKLDKVATETAALKQKISDLETVVGGMDQAPQELVDALEAVKSKAQSIDDLVPDQPGNPPA